MTRRQPVARLLVSLLASAFALLAAWPASAGGLPVAVDERIELLTIVARLAGADEYTMGNSTSPYSERVAKHFGPHQGHPAIAAFQAMRADHGVGFDAVPSLALHLDAVPSLAERIPFDQHPPRLDARWSLEPTRAFLVQLRDFAKVSDAAGFFASEKEFYGKAAARLAETLKEIDAIAWFDAFLGEKAGASYAIIPGLLCGGGNYGVGVRFLDATPEEIRPVLGCYRWDESGLPTFTTDTEPLLVHELCHSYTNAFVDRHATEMQAAAETLFAANEGRMRRQAYAEWRTLLYESLVRACVIRYMTDRHGQAAGAKAAAEEAGAGFTWAGDLAKDFDRYASSRTTYKTLDDFAPEIAKSFERAATKVGEIAQKRPRVLSMTPDNGSASVDPALATLTITFDRRMRTDSWSFVGSKDDVPSFDGKPSFDASGKVFSVAMKLVRGKTYHYFLNSDRFTGFRAADGTPLEPVEVRFTVAP